MAAVLLGGHQENLRFRCFPSMMHRGLVQFVRYVSLFSFSLFSLFDCHIFCVSHLRVFHAPSCSPKKKKEDEDVKLFYFSLLRIKEERKEWQTIVVFCNRFTMIHTAKLYTNFRGNKELERETKRLFRCLIFFFVESEREEMEIITAH